MAFISVKKIRKVFFREKMSGYFKLIEKLTKRPTTKILHSGSISLSTTKVYMDIGNRVLLFFFYQELKKTKKF